MDYDQPEQNPTAASNSNKNNALNTGAASHSDFAITPEHNNTEDVVKVEKNDIHQINESHTTTSQNPTSKAPSPEAANPINSPEPLDDVPLSKDAFPKIGIKDPTDQMFIAALMGNKDNKPNPIPLLRVESPTPENHEATVKNELETQYPGQRKNTDKLESTTTHLNVFDPRTPPSKAIAEPKQDTETTTVPSKPQPATALSDADMARKANAKSKAPFLRSSLSLSLHVPFKYSLLLLLLLLLL